MSKDNVTRKPNSISLLLGGLVMLGLLSGISSAVTGATIKFETADGANADLETPEGVLTNSATLPCPDGNPLTMTISIIDPDPGLSDMRIVSSGTAGLGIRKSGVANDNATHVDTGEVFEITFDQDVWLTEIEIENFRFAKESDSTTQNDTLDLTVGSETQHYVATTDYMGGISHEALDLSVYSSLFLTAGDAILLAPTAAGALSLDGSSHIRLHSVSVYKVPEPSTLWLLGMGLILPLNKLRRR